MRKIDERKTICWLDYIIFFVDDFAIELYGWTNWIRQDYFEIGGCGKKNWVALNFFTLIDLDGNDDLAPNLC